MLQRSCHIVTEQPRLLLFTTAGVLSRLEIIEWFGLVYISDMVFWFLMNYPSSWSLLLTPHSKYPPNTLARGCLWILLGSFLHRKALIPKIFCRVSTNSTSQIYCFCNQHDTLAELKGLKSLILENSCSFVVSLIHIFCSVSFKCRWQMCLLLYSPSFCAFSNFPLILLHPFFSFL